MHEVFTRSLTQALPLAARQTLWQLHACGLPVGPRTGGAGHCPIALAVDGTQTDEDHTQVALLSPIARSVWTQVLTGLRATQLFDLSFADAFMGGAQPSRDVRRFCLLGLQPVGAPVLAGPLRELLALLRGVLVHAIVSHRHGVGLALAEAGDDYQYDLTRSTAAMYEQCRSGVLRALVEARSVHGTAYLYVRCVALACRLRRAMAQTDRSPAGRVLGCGLVSLRCRVECSALSSCLTARPTPSCAMRSCCSAAALGRTVLHRRFWRVF